MKVFLIWVILLIVVGIPTYACCRAASRADRWYEEHAKDMLSNRCTEDTP